MARDIPRSIERSAKNPQLGVSIRIGKEGISEALISELSEQLRRKRLVKIKANKGIASGNSGRNEIFESIASETSSKLVFQRGNVAVLWNGK